MRRTAALTVALTSSLAIAATPADGPTTVATDDCGLENVNDVAETVVLPWHDLCSLSIVTIGGAGGGVTELEVRVDMLSMDRPTPTMVTTRWDVGGCVMRLIHGDETPEQEAISAFSMMCEGDEPLAQNDCTVNEPGIYCTDGRPTIDIAPPTVDGTTLVWRMRFEGDLAIAAPLHAHGSELTIQATVASPRIWESSPAHSGIACYSDSCFGVATDTMSAPAGTVYTIG